jgi:hypothetical protein
MMCEEVEERRNRIAQHNKCKYQESVFLKTTSGIASHIEK